MATPNIVNVTSINGKTITLIPTTTILTQLGSAVTTGHVFKVNSIVATNVTAVAATITVGIYPTNNITGIPIRIIYQIPVPGNAALVVVDKSLGLYISETQSIGVTSGTSDSIELTMTYEDIS